MTIVDRREPRHGAGAFARYYEELYGDRWDALSAALRDDPPRVALEEGLLRPYYLDSASVLAAKLLDVQPGNRVLDLCAAPGGKTLVLAIGLGAGEPADVGRGDPGSPGAGSLVSNERSATRRGRLRDVLDRHLPPKLRSLVRVTGHDAARWGLYEPASYDRVLADVPCSSERHVLTDPRELARWSASRSKRLAAAAYAILCAAVDAVVPGGRVVYCTCALSVKENDDVVQRLISRRGGAEALSAREEMAAAIARLPLVGEGLPGEPTRFGWQITPDRDGGRGPIYSAVLLRQWNLNSAGTTL